MDDPLTAADRQRFARAHENGRNHLNGGTALVAARYNEQRDALELVFRDTTTVTIPRSLLPEFASVPLAALTTACVSPAGDAISWRSLDIDLDVRGLLERAARKT
jgi:hypothetical protein